MLNLPSAREIFALTLGLAASIFAPLTVAGSGQVFLIHTGDIHGHLVPRPNVRSDAVGGTEGGLARMYTLIQQIRSKARQGKVNRSLLINTGDTLQGSGEALFTRGQAMIDVLNLFKLDAHAPGNWDFLYGTARFEEVFKGTNERAPLAPWNALASNLYYTKQFDDATECGITGKDAHGTIRKLKRVLPPYAIKRLGEVKVGLLGFTTARAVAALGPKVTAGYEFTDAEIELPCYVDLLRNREKVDLLVMISELELSKDIKLVEVNSGVDVVLNSDMHEKTTRPIIVRHASAPSTLLFEEGQDGTMLGELQLDVKGGKIADWKWTPHIISAAIKEDKGIVAKVTEVRKPFLKGSFVPGQSVTVGGNTSTLLHPVDEVIAYSQVSLHRSNFVDEDMPAVVEGSSHDLIADAMRWAAGTDAATLRGFRYGTHIPAGQPITMEDIYHLNPCSHPLNNS
ncbi:bifunctional UDP-sugar hydrolase/5'-nucleotidase [Methylococcus sp. Mc7]|uniref:bifunctional metallophosphatase/5'-nucleotidase n=1 Tax=Methylococcus sp. Mc7 TaxID=2860258 RepID=UPI001C52C4D6|nr:5'-nucleotidase C-terminal domain-containing protein [Methylococcus sp. Mc7]QXP82929.1 bifunctional metallophosphatase/5'-nucleotidase [Methylococcus sp. Mc7]